MSKNTESPLLAAARLLSEELSRFDTLSGELSRMPLNSEKALERARQSLEACATHEAKLAESLRGFALAMQGMQQGQLACMEATAKAADRIAARQAQRVDLQERLALLGQNARDVSVPFSELADPMGAPASDTPARLQEVERRLGAVIAEAGELCELAERDDWNDVQRDTQSLREKLQALRNRVLLMRRKLASEAPS